MMQLTAVFSLVTLLLPQGSIGFAPQQHAPASRIMLQAATPPEVGSTSSEPTAFGGAPTSTTAATTVFPVLRRISGIDWEGDCRYIDADLCPVADLKLTGGLRYDLDPVNAACTMSSFLTFPNGQARRVVMAGFQTAGSPTMRLDAVEEGPIYMTLAELYPDTVLVNEIEAMSGKVVMTTSLSVVNGGKELVMMSHEVGDGRSTQIDGHQIWRLKKAKPVTEDDGDEVKNLASDGLYRDATGR
mmetsp:Transcript_481/g.961  ORF Transcript_481/g.961 Transcript_481/m.961 type:complete len:243 (-) Transcript_481:311-1039(-)|eukprot:CAMPEP_0172310182 /NCGR_PEP_ID=MMETSP1058-20130122/11339_1 /TAXON_ID=83371 /ORGANISM="Detonula confervacea, Strain CCMP 353" /LENGTH=242 /DNA_ID=CAMNT_0013022951 /DNA_START=24 /DNA_END=752 /DNA_ORIENTATION=+